MIEASITGTLPDFEVTDFDEPLHEAANIMLTSVRENFAAGGRPVTWPVLARTGFPSHLVDSGELAGSIMAEVGGDYAEVHTDVPYAAIHNFGGVIQHPGSQMFQAFTIGGKWVFTQHTRPHPIHIPQREFMMFQQEDIDRIITLFQDYTFFLIDSSGRPI